MKMYSDNIKEFPRRWHVLLHTLWTKAVDTPKYNKKEWQELEQILLNAARMHTKAGEGKHDIR